MSLLMNISFKTSNPLTLWPFLRSMIKISFIFLLSAALFAQKVEIVNQTKVPKAKDDTTKAEIVDLNKVPKIKSNTSKTDFSNPKKVIQKKEPVENKKASVTSKKEPSSNKEGKGGALIGAIIIGSLALSFTMVYIFAQYYQASTPSEADIEAKW